MRERIKKNKEAPEFLFKGFRLDLDKAKHKERLWLRANRMIQNGIVEEVQRVFKNMALVQDFLL